jgi:peptidoglycan/LPS O-acetylase OafA/YrhL
MTAVLEPDATRSGRPGRSRLTGLDGIRGLAALYVVVDHIYLRSFPGFPRITAPFWAGWFIYGRFAVVVFIVLSGFSLAVSPSRDGWRLDGVPTFLKRRAWRILPPYWAALLFSLLVAWLIIAQPGTPVPTLKSVYAHGLLLQDVIDSPTPNKAFWTIAIEAQLYLVFPLLLLMIRRVSGLAMAAAVTLVVVAVGLAAPHSPLANAAAIRLELDFAALFAIGMMAAGIVTAGQRLRSLPWHLFALAGAVPVLAIIVVRGSVWTTANLYWVDLAFGPAIACLLAAVATGRPTSFVRLLDTRGMRTLGSMSYSLYLTHAPIVVVLNEWLIVGHIRQGVPSFLISVLVIVPATLLFARGFAALFEIPFVRHRGWPALRESIPSWVRPSLVRPAWVWPAWVWPAWVWPAWVWPSLARPALLRASWVWSAVQCRAAALPTRVRSAWARRRYPGRAASPAPAAPPPRAPSARRTPSPTRAPAPSSTSD